MSTPFRSRQIKLRKIYYVVFHLHALTSTMVVRMVPQVLPRSFVAFFFQKKSNVARNSLFWTRSQNFERKKKQKPESHNKYFQEVKFIPRHLHVLLHHLFFATFDFFNQFCRYNWKVKSLLFSEAKNFRQLEKLSAFINYIYKLKTFTFLYQNFQLIRPLTNFIFITLNLGAIFHL